MKALFVSGSVLMAAWLSTGVGFAQSPERNKRDAIHPDVSGKGTSMGESKSERTGETGAPLPQGSPYSGTVEKGKSSGEMDRTNTGGSRSATGMHGNAQNVKAIQQALKDKGHDPGPIDGVMGSQTKQALKSFQSANNLQPTGTLNAETAEKLGIQSGSQQLSSRSSSRSQGTESSGSMGSRNRASSSDTTVGKDTDQPNQTPAKNR